MKGRWRELLSTLADLATVVSLGVMLLAGRGYALGRLSRTWLTVVLVAVLAALGVLAYLRRRAWWGAIRPRYVSCVAWLAKPVSREVQARLGPGSWVEALGEAAARVPGLRVDALKALQFALAALGNSGGGPCSLRASQVYLDEPFSYAGVSRLEKACSALVSAGMVSRYETDWPHFEVKVWLRREVQVADERGELSRLVREELGRRGK